MMYPKPVAEPKKRKRIRTKTTHEKVADAAFGLYVKTLAGWQCEKCGLQAPGSLLPDGRENMNLEQIERDVLDVSHFVRRSHMAGRYNCLNVDILCRVDHAYFEDKKNFGRAYFLWKQDKLAHGNIGPLQRTNGSEVNAVIATHDFTIEAVFRLKNEIVKYCQQDFIEISNHHLHMLESAGFQVQWFREKYRDFL